MTTKVEEYPKGSIDEMEKIFKVIHASDTEGFVAYQLKNMAN